MAKYRKKALTVEANRFTGDTTPLPPGVYSYGGHADRFYCITLHGHETPLAVGDWVILEDRQDRPGTVLAYPCKADVFERNYEQA